MYRMDESRVGFLSEILTILSKTDRGQHPRLQHAALAFTREVEAICDR